MNDAPPWVYDVAIEISALTGFPSSMAIANLIEAYRNAAIEEQAEEVPF